MNTPNPIMRVVTKAQALYFIPFSLLGLVHRRTFEWITGKKQDYWLVRTVCLLLVTIGGVIGRAGRNGRVTPEIAVLGIGSSASLAAVDLWYAGVRNRIRWVYLLDALANAGLVAGWFAAIRAREDDPT